MTFTKCLLLTLTSSLLILQPTSADDYGFDCLGENRTQIKFKNRVDELVPDMWPVRIMMGGYGTQYAFNYAAYMFMREKLGINATFYPSTVTGPDYWNLFGENLSYENYPDLYWGWLENDEMDVNFEFWVIQEVRGDAYSYYAEGTVVNGFVGVFGEISLWLPKYFVEAYPTSIIPSVLKNDATIRGLLINGSIYGGETNWVEAYGTGGSHRTFTTSYDIPDGTRPICWASIEGYTQTDVAHGLVNTVEGGMDFDVVSAGESSERPLFDIILDLYDNRAPFCANIYVPDDNFAVIDNQTLKYQNFEKVAFPRNPNQIMSDPCIANRSCQYPLEPIKKAANIRLQTRFPEAYQFYTSYAMEATQLADVLRHYNRIAKQYPTMGTHEQWLRASCNWLKDPKSASVWNNSNWLLDIERYDCIPGCGLPVNPNDPDGPFGYYGGTCDYQTKMDDVDSGTCHCDFDELHGQFCDKSCAGLVGPYVDLESDHLKFDWCSGHGTCDTTNYLCHCDKGHGGKGCQTAYEKYEFPLGLGGTIIAFSSILACVAMACIVWLRMNATYKTVKALSIQLTTVFSFGLVMIACSNIALVVHRNSASCIAWQWLFGLGGILSIMSPLLKAYRVSRVFHGGKMLRAVKITDKMLLNNLFKAALLEIALCTAYSIFHEVNGGTQLYYNDDELRTERHCNEESITVLLSIASYAYFFIMLCALTYYSYGTRRALSVFQESTCAYSSSFLSMFCTLITLAFYAATDDPTFRFTVQAVAIIIVVGAVLGLFYGVRIYKFFMDPEGRNVTDNRAPTYTASSTTAHTSTNVMSPSTGNKV